jgi:hypothetical protein
MKSTLSRLLILSFFSLLISCGKDSDPDPGLLPVVDSPKTGFLCTIGQGNVSYNDTLVYNAYGGIRELVQWLSEGNDLDERVTLSPRGDGIWSLERVKPYITSSGDEYSYFGCYAIGTTAGYPAGYSEFLDSFGYKYSLRATFTPDCKFVLTRDDVDPELFYLESKLYPGYYLTPAQRKEGPGNAQRWLVYGTAKHAFFIIE